MKISINVEKLEEFCNINDFKLVTDQELIENGMYKNLVYATENNFVGKRVYPENMPIIMNNEVWKKLVKN